MGLPVAGLPQLIGVAAVGAEGQQQVTRALGQVRRQGVIIGQRHVTTNDRVRPDLPHPSDPVSPPTQKAPGHLAGALGPQPTCPYLAEMY